MAHRLWLEIRPAGGVPEDRVATLRALYPDVEYEQLREMHSRLLEEHIRSRSPVKPADDESYMSGSLGELEIHLKRSVDMLAQVERAGDLDLQDRVDLLRVVAERREVLERLRTWLLDYLVSAELEMQLSDPVAHQFAQHRRSVDRMLARVAPGIGDQLQAAVRTAQQGDGESRSQVLLTCRRVIVAVADEIYPASETLHISSDGTQRSVGKSQYRNRILAGIEQQSTVDKAFAAALSELAGRLDRLDELAQKGVHDNISELEMAFGLTQTYLLAGELVARADSSC